MVEVFRQANSPYWYYDITVNGQRSRRSTRRRRKTEAVAVARAELTRALDAQQLADLRPITLRAAIFEHYLPSKTDAASYANLKRQAHYLCGDRKGIASLGGDLNLHELTSSLLRRYRSARKAQGASDQSIDHEVKVVSAAYNLVREDYLVRPGLKFPMARPKGRPRFLTTSEEKALLADLDPDRPLKARGGGTIELRKETLIYRQRQDNYDLTVMLLDTGCRFGELASLTWAMVDTVGWNWVHVYRSKVDNEGRFATTSRMRGMLKDRSARRGGGEYVFGGAATAGVAGPRSSTNAIREAMARVGINSAANIARFGKRDVRSLRDTFATKLRSNGMPLDRLQKLLGHSSPQMTQKYAHLAVDRASEEAVALLDRLEAAGGREC